MVSAGLSSRTCNAMCKRLWVTLALLILSCVLTEEVPLIKPSRLLIGTVIDTTNSDIVRDAINFIKSVRVFGGTMNEATILVGITSSYDNCSVDSLLLPTLVDLDVEVVLVTQTVKHAKTLNKFKMFDLFDPISFDYFLWIDADIIVFTDPMPYLHMHKYPGEIECVPDFYSYMRRFGSVNTSSEYWNPSLPTFHLLGEHETAPSGLCNTGLLFFDGLSLSTFQEGLHRIMSNRSYLEQHGQDRFVDSLIFTEVVQEKALQVAALPYSLNFMALFEIEMQEEAVVNEIVMAHLVSDTELYCVRTPSEEPGSADTCACVYRNKLMSPKGSLLKKTIEDKILVSREICLIFAGAPLPKAHEPEPFLTSVDNIAEDIRNCRLLSQPGAGFALRSASRGEAVQLGVEVRCEVSPQYVDSQGTVDLSNHLADAIDGLVFYQSTVVYSTGAARCAGHSCTFSAQYTLEFTCPALINFKEPTSHLVLVIHVGGQRLTTTFSVAFEDLIPPGQVHYSTNLLLSAKPVALESQLLLPEYLNARQMRGTGVVACCDLHKGVVTVKRLIKHWRGDHLLIVVARTPHDDDPQQRAAAETPASAELEGAATTAAETERLHQLADELREECNARMRADSPAHNFMCFVSLSPRSPGGEWVAQVASTLRSDSVQFVYSDVSADYARHFKVMSQWTQVLTKGGLLVGTQYVAARKSGPVPDWNPPSLVHLPHILRDRQRVAVHADSTAHSDCDSRRAQASRAADALALKLAQSALFTHSEREPHFCDAFLRSDSNPHGPRGEDVPSATMLFEARSIECAPAWFLFKQRASA